jgi:plastocyanin
MQGPLRSIPAILRQVVVIITLIAAAGPIAAPAAAVTTFHDAVGAQSGDEAIQALAFLPNDLTVNVGDSIVWDFPTDEVHTVTFLPAPGAPNVQMCNGAPSSTDQCIWNGTSEVNSGIKEDGESYAIIFTLAGDFSFRCLIHQAMTGTLHVHAAGAAYPSSPQDDVAEGKRQAAQLLQQGSQMRGQELAQADPQHGLINIGAGFVRTTSGGDQSVLIARFLPNSVSVHVGDTVTWNAQDPATPHTVTFGEEPSNPRPPIGLTGPGESTTLSTPYPQRFVGPTVSSGFLGQGQPGGTTFKVTFAAPGVYEYYCALHDELGMLGTINVLPGNDATVHQQSVNPTEPQVGGIATLTMTLNLGSAQSNVTLDDTISNAGQSPATHVVPGSATLNSSTIGDPGLATNQPNRITFHFALGNLAAGQYTLVYQVQLSPSLGCHATVGSGANLDAQGVNGHLSTSQTSFSVHCT